MTSKSQVWCPGALVPALAMRHLALHGVGRESDVHRAMQVLHLTHRTVAKTASDAKVPSVPGLVRAILTRLTNCQGSKAGAWRGV